MHPYRTHHCGELRQSHTSQKIRLSGWVHRKRDHGNLLFIDLRDHYGLTQCVIDVDSPAFASAESLRVESVITLNGTVVQRTPDTVNKKMTTGDIEVQIDSVTLQSQSEMLPLQVNSNADFS